MKTVAVIVNHNNTDNLIKLVSTIKDYANLDAIVVVDNLSEDITEIKKLSEEIDKVTLIQAEKNGGYGYGNNIGLRWAKENGFTHALICNPDTEYTQECVQAMIDAIKGDVAVAAPICITPDSKYDAPKSGWCIKSWGQELLDKGPISRRIFKNYINKADDGSCVDAVLGSCLMVDVDKFIEVGGYDDDIFLYCEENILGYKMREFGYNTVLLSDYQYLHKHKPDKPSKKAIENLADSELHYFERYLLASNFQLVVSRIFFDFVEFEAFIASR